MPELELLEAGVIVRPGNDDGADVIACIEKFNSALEDWLTAKILIEFRPGCFPGVGVEAGGGAGGGDDDGDAHAGDPNHLWHGRMPTVGGGV